MEYTLLLREEPYENWGNSIIDAVVNPAFQKIVKEQNLEYLGFWAYLPLKEYPIVLNCAANNGLYQFIQDGAFLFGPAKQGTFGDYEFSIEKDEVLITFLDFYVLFKKAYFLQYCILFAQKALEGCEKFDLVNRGLVDKNWVMAIRSSLHLMQKSA